MLAPLSIQVGPIYPQMLMEGWMWARLVVAGAIASAICTGVARADIAVAVAVDGSDRLVIANKSDVMTQMTESWLIMNQGELVPFSAVAKCEDFGSRYVEMARNGPTVSDKIVGWYNAVNLWLGRACHGRSDIVPTTQEGRAWIEEVAGIKVGSNQRPMMDSHEMKALFLIFGARDVAPNPDAAMAYIAPKAESNPGRWGLTMAYLYREGVGTLPDHALAWKWIEKAADANDRGALLLRAQALETGAGRPRDEAAAFKIYESGTWSEAKFRAALMLLDGRGIAKDACRAKELLEQAQAHRWSPIDQAKRHLDRIATEGLCRT